MVRIVDRYIGSNGDVLIPLGSESDNVNNLISSTGIFYIVQSHETATLQVGSPMGLLLSLTYAAV